MIQKTRKRQKRFFLGLGATSRLTVPCLTDTLLHRNLGQRGVLSHQENKLPITLNLQDPFFRLTGCHPRQTGGISSSQRGQLLLTKLATFPVGIEPPGPRQGGKFNTQGKENEECWYLLILKSSTRNAGSLTPLPTMRDCP